MSTIQGIAQKQAKALRVETRLNIGNTPLVLFKSLSTGKVQIWAKLEWKQAGGSVKARAANQIIRAALAEGRISKDLALLDASSGNTAIAYATILRRLQLRTVICLPSNASGKRIDALRSLGAELILTSPGEGTEGAQIEARKIFAQNPDKFFYADQYSNPANWQAHYHGTGPEILAQTKGKVTHFVAGLGTTGTFTGTARRLKEYNPDISVTALQPNSPLHALEGWKHLPTASIPKIYDPHLADLELTIDSEDAYDMIRHIRQHEGYLISPSAAANLVGAQKIAENLESGLIVTVLPDSLERYEEVSQFIFGEILS